MTMNLDFATMTPGEVLAWLSEKRVALQVKRSAEAAYLARRARYGARTFTDLRMGQDQVLLAEIDAFFAYLIEAGERSEGAMP